MDRQQGSISSEMAKAGQCETSRDCDLTDVSLDTITFSAADLGQELGFNFDFGFDYIVITTSLVDMIASEDHLIAELERSPWKAQTTTQYLKA